ncbi:MAG: hypothetical protein EON58_03235 [Alphaproteobacteria bacterium]|nr:MAG: hypothetical protein EON58_03235 [Alphaproteobacteria bacterium]
MMFVFAELKAGSESAAIAALSQHLAGAPQLFDKASAPAGPKADPSLASDIAEAIKPRANQPMRREVLQKLMTGHDTFWSQQGEADANLRNGTAALSRALRPFSKWDSPLDLLFVRERKVIKDGVYKGKYEGTSYTLTALGKAVRDILRAKKLI